MHKLRINVKGSQASLLIMSLLFLGGILFFVVLITTLPRKKYNLQAK